MTKFFHCSPAAAIEMLALLLLSTSPLIFAAFQPSMHKLYKVQTFSSRPGPDPYWNWDNSPPRNYNEFDNGPPPPYQENEPQDYNINDGYYEEPIMEDRGYREENFNYNNNGQYDYPNYDNNRRVDGYDNFNYGEEIGPFHYDRHQYPGPPYQYQDDYPRYEQRGFMNGDYLPYPDNRGNSFGYNNNGYASGPQSRGQRNEFNNGYPYPEDGYRQRGGPNNRIIPNNYRNNYDNDSRFPRRSNNHGRYSNNNPDYQQQQKIREDRPMFPSMPFPFLSSIMPTFQPLFPSNMFSMPMFPPFLFGMANTDEMEQSRAAMQNMMQQARKILTNDAGVAQKIGTPLQFSRPFSQSSSASTVNGKMSTFNRANFEIVGSYGRGIAIIESKDGEITSLVVDFNGEMINILRNTYNYEGRSDVKGGKKDNVIEAEIID